MGDSRQQIRQNSQRRPRYDADFLLDDAYDDFIACGAKPPKAAPAWPKRVRPKPVSVYQQPTEQYDIDPYAWNNGRMKVLWVSGLIFIAALLMTFMTYLATSGAMRPRASLGSKAVVEIPSNINAKLADVTDGFKETDMALFWEIPMSLGMKLSGGVFSDCFGLVQASGIGSDRSDKELTVVKIQGRSYVNVNTMTRDGLDRAKDLGFFSSRIADVIISRIPFEVTARLPMERRGRMFTVIRHPITRAVNHYYYSRKFDNIFLDMSLEVYAGSNEVENNWLTRYLTGHKGGDLTEEDFQRAKEILRRKCIVGLSSELSKSLELFAAYFGWKVSESTPDSPSTECIETFLTENVINRDPPAVKEGGKIWILLKKQNTWDIRLYEFAVTLFEFQRNTIVG